MDFEVKRLFPKLKTLEAVNTDPYKGKVEAFNSWNKNWIGLGKTITPERIQEFIDSLLPNYKPSTIRVFKFAIQKSLESSARNRIQEMAVKTAMREIKIPQVKHSIDGTKIFSGEDVQSVIDSVNVKNGVLIRFILNHGLRISEVLSLRWKSSENIGNGYWKVEVLGKRKKVRCIFPTDKEIDEIKTAWDGKDYLFGRGDKLPPSRNYVWQVLRNAGKNVLNRKLTPHRLRHSFAQAKISDGVSPKSISQYLGHSKTETTVQFYLNDSVSPGDMKPIIPTKDEKKNE